MSGPNDGPHTACDSTPEESPMSAALAAVEAFIDGVGDALGWLIVAVMLLIADTYRRIKSNTDRIDNLDRHITGDDDDPNSPGLLSEVHSTRERVDEMSDKMDNHHRRTDEKLDELIDND